MQGSPNLHLGFAALFIMRSYRDVLLKTSAAFFCVASGRFGNYISTTWNSDLASISPSHITLEIKPIGSGAL